MATADDGTGGIEGRLEQFAAALDVGTVATPGERDHLQRLLREAAAALGECRRAIEASRVWWDEDYSPYHIRWQHRANDGGPCRCDVCKARDAARAAMARLGEGDSDA